MESMIHGRLAPRLARSQVRSTDWIWQADWAPRHDEAFNQDLVQRWFDQDLRNVDWTGLLDDPRWDPACRWLGTRSPVVSCGWDLALMNAPNVDPERWFDRLGETLGRRWTMFPALPHQARPEPSMTSTLLQAMVSADVLNPSPSQEDSPPDPAMDQRCAMIRALSRRGVDLNMGQPDAQRPGWFRRPDGQVSLLALATQKPGGHRLALALLDAGLSLAVQLPDGASDVDELLDMVGKLPANPTVKEHWPRLLMQALCTVPAGPEWTAWRARPQRGIVERCVVHAAVQVETQVLRQALVNAPMPSPGPGVRGRTRL